MIAKTLYCLLENLTEEEKSRLADYIASPFFNKDKNVIRLYDFLQKKMKQKKMQNFNKQAVAKYVFPNIATTTAERKINGLLKKIEQLILDFLINLKVEENANNRVIFLLEALNDRHIENVWQKVWQKASAKHKKVSSNLAGFRHNYLLAKNWYEFAVFDSKLKSKINLQDLIQSFETYYITQMLQYLCSALNNKQNFNQTFNLPMLSSTLKLVQERQLSEKEPLINCYKTLIFLLKTREQSHLNELLDILQNDTLEIEKHDLAGIYTIAISYCIVQYNQGNKSFGEYILALYTQMLKTDCLISNHYLDYMHFKNILTMAVRLKKMAWAKTFVAEYESKLNPIIRHDMKCYSQGIIAFYEKKYEEAQLLFLQVNELNFIFHLNKEVYLLKVFYLCNNVTLLESKLETLRSYLRQNKQLTLKTRTEYSNFYKMLKQLCRIKGQYAFLKNNPLKLKKIQKQIEKLLASLESSTTIKQKIWLKEQAEALYQKF